MFSVRVPRFRIRSIRSGFREYNKQHPEVKINYQSIGSGGGIRQVTEGTVDFGASDGPMTDAQLRASKVKLIHIPTVLGAVVPIYNVPGVAQELKFSQDAVAGIYLGKITKWNDPYLARENPGVNLPDKVILPVYRSESSGTTYIFTDWLSKVSPLWRPAWARPPRSSGRSESARREARALPGWCGNRRTRLAMWS